MSSEPKEQPAPEPRRRPERAEDPGAWQPDPARDHDLAAAELGYDPDDPATWPGNAPPVPAGSVPAGSVPVTAPAETPDDDDVVRLTDATAMRALAHPVRMALLELFNFRETLTATQASELLGESPANCAFHLRTLAKYGFVREAGGGKGRERPWAVVNRHFSVTTEQADAQATLAADELLRLYFERWVDRTRRVLGSGKELPDWDEAPGWSNRHVFLTHEEALMLRTEMQQMLDRYEGRVADPELRPAGAFPVEWTIFVTPAPEHVEPVDPVAATQDDSDAADPVGAANPKAAPEHSRAWASAPGADDRDADHPDATDS